MKQTRITRVLLLGCLALQPALLNATPKIGVFPKVQSGSAGAYTDQYEDWLGRDMDYIVQFVPGDTWTNLSGNNWWIQGWRTYAQSYRDRMVLSVPMLPNDAATTLAKGANGDYNTQWAAFADRYIAEGYGNCIIRLGWEFNGDWYRWTMKGTGANGVSNATNFKNYWIKIVDTIRSRPGANFKFCWNPTVGDPSQAGPPLSAYPGTNYVDQIGLDIYDTSRTYYRDSGYSTYFETGGNATAVDLNSCRSNGWLSNAEWGNYHMKWWRTEVATSTSPFYGKPLCIPEWGLDTPGSSDYLYRMGGRDNPTFIRKMHDWIYDPANKVAWHAYFEAGDGTSGRNHQICFSKQYPRSRASFPQFFGNPSTQNGTVATKHEAEALTSTESDAVTNSADTAASGGVVEVLGANAATGDYITYTIPNIAGSSVSIRAGVKTYSARGKFQLSIDGVTYGPIHDQYAATTTWPELHLGGFSSTAVVTKNFKFDVKDKNASSTGYSAAFDYIKLTKAGPILFEGESVVWKPVSAGTAATVTDANASGGKYTQFDATAVGQNISINIPDVGAAIYNVKVRYKVEGAGGKCRLYLDSSTTPFGPELDQYAATAGFVETDMGSLTLTSSGLRKIKFQVSAAGAGGGYKLTIDSIILTR